MPQIEITIKGITQTLNVTVAQIRALEEATIVNKRFFKLGDEYYNVEYLEHWKESDELVESAPRESAIKVEDM